MEECYIWHSITYLARRVICPLNNITYLHFFSVNYDNLFKVTKQEPGHEHLKSCYFLYHYNTTCTNFPIYFNAFYLVFAALYPMRTSEKPKVFWYFQWVKRCKILESIEIIDN